jgi:nucleoid-associated protein YgaU
MFNKRERIEDDFMSYGSEQAEKSSKEGGFLSKFIQFLTVVVLMGIVGFMGLFGYRYMQKEGIVTPAQEPLASEANEKSTAATSNLPAEQTNVSQNKVSLKQKMYTQEEMQEIVKMLMMQMQNGQKVSLPSEQKEQSPQEQLSDTSESADELVAALDLAEVDEVEESESDLPVEIKNADSVKAKAAESSKKVDHYNKVVVKKSANTYDDLANLSKEIGNIVETMNSKKAKKSDYTASIQKEVTTRESEMRVVIVRSGDTLSKIAKRAYGRALDYDRILKANPDLIKNPNNIYVGQRLRVPMNEI